MLLVFHCVEVRILFGQHPCERLPDPSFSDCHRPCSMRPSRDGSIRPGSGRLRRGLRRTCSWKVSYSVFPIINQSSIGNISMSLPRTIPVLGTGWSPREGIWVGVPPVPTGTNKFVDPMIEEG